MNILFQGDSITDAGRDRDRIHPQYLGNGYVSEIALRLKKSGLPHHVRNTAIGGDRICDIYSRWIEDTLNFDFDILSVLCGINDVGFQIRENKGVPTEKYKFIYDRMLYEVMEKNPKTQIVILEPFVFKRNLEDTNRYFGNDIFLNYDYWRSEVEEKAAAAREVAQKYHSIFVPLMDMFDRYTAGHRVEELTDDGIHPTLKGHKLIADEWLKACRNLIEG